MLGHRFRTVAACALLAVALIACGGSDDARGQTTTTVPPATSTTTSASSTTLDPAQQAEADVRAAYDAYWAMNQRLAAAPDPQDPEIAERTSGGARDAITTLLTQFLTEGYTVNFEEEYAHEVLEVEVEDGSARIRDCYIDHASRLDAE